MEKIEDIRPTAELSPEMIKTICDVISEEFYNWERKGNCDYGQTMLEKCQKYFLAINAEGKPFPTEPLIIALLLEQHKMINWLQNKVRILKQRFFKF